jgi:hypothetical protein
MCYKSCYLQVEQMQPTHLSSSPTTFHQLNMTQGLFSTHCIACYAYYIFFEYVVSWIGSLGVAQEHDLVF